MKYAALFFMLFASGAFGQTECDRNCAQSKAGSEFEKVDAELNLVYRRLMSSLSQAQKDKLRVEQRLWIHEVRDASCAKRIETEWGGSCPTTWCVIAEEQCRVSETQERTKQLEQMVEGVIR